MSGEEIEKKREYERERERWAPLILIIKNRLQLVSKPTFLSLIIPLEESLLDLHFFIGDNFIIY